MKTTKTGKQFTMELPTTVARMLGQMCTEQGKYPVKLIEELIRKEFERTGLIPINEINRSCMKFMDELKKEGKL